MGHCFSVTVRQVTESSRRHLTMPEHIAIICTFKSSHHPLLSFGPKNIYRSPVFSFKTQTKINYECYTVYCTLSFTRESVVGWMGVGFPAMGCLGPVLEMREAGIDERKRRALKVGPGRDCTRLLLMRELCLQCVSSYCCISCRGTVITRTAASRQKQKASPGTGGFHHEEGAPTLLFLMVASEHSASDESQSESPN